MTENINVEDTKRTKAWVGRYPGLCIFESPEESWGQMEERIRRERLAFCIPSR